MWVVCKTGVVQACRCTVSVFVFGAGVGGTNMAHMHFIHCLEVFRNEEDLSSTRLCGEMHTDWILKRKSEHTLTTAVAFALLENGMYKCEYWLYCIQKMCLILKQRFIQTTSQIRCKGVALCCHYRVWDSLLCSPSLQLSSPLPWALHHLHKLTGQVAI